MPLQAENKTVKEICIEAYMEEAPEEDINIAETWCDANLDYGDLQKNFHDKAKAVIRNTM